MEFTVNRRDDVVIVTIRTDRLDMNNATIFKRAMEPVLSDVREAILDLGGVRFVDSSGIGALLSCLRRLTAAGGNLRLASLQRSVRSTMELVRMHRVFDIYPTTEDAFEATRTTARS